jgi:hypothetical protein
MRLAVFVVLAIGQSLASPAALKTMMHDKNATMWLWNGCDWTTVPLLAWLLFYWFPRRNSAGQCCAGGGSSSLLHSLQRVFLWTFPVNFFGWELWWSTAWGPAAKDGEAASTRVYGHTENVVWLDVLNGVSRSGGDMWIGVVVFYLASVAWALVLRPRSEMRGQGDVDKAFLDGSESSSEDDIRLEHTANNSSSASSLHANAALAFTSWRSHRNGKRSYRGFLFAFFLAFFGVLQDWVITRVSVASEASLGKLGKAPLYPFVDGPREITVHATWVLCPLIIW